jgi:hypothetical protein
MRPLFFFNFQVGLIPEGTKEEEKMKMEFRAEYDRRFLESREGQKANPAIMQ